MTADPGPPLLDTPHGRIFLIAAMVGVLGQLLFLVILKLDRRGERRVYWGSSAAIIGCLFFGFLPHWKLGTQIAVVLGFAFVSTAFCKTSCIKIGSRIYAARADDRRPDSAVDELIRHPPGGNSARIWWASAVLVVVFAVAVSEWHPDRTSHHSPSVTLPAAVGIGAGVGIAVTYADRSDVVACTAGFLVRTRAGEAGLLTAGHCNQPGGTGVVTINYANSTPYRVIGTVQRTVVASDDRRDGDIALVILEDPGQIPLLSTVAGRAITGATGHVSVGERLCHLGLYTRTEECGPVVATAGSQVIYDAASGCGDSGGPVYIKRYGGVVAVGMHVAGLDRDGSGSGCGTTHRHSIAELIQPWLDTWDLTIVTTSR